MGLVDDVQKQAIEYYQIDGVFAIDQNLYEIALEDFDNVMGAICEDGGDLNVYNYRDFGEYNFTLLDTYLNEPSVGKYYNVAPSMIGNFVDENEDVYNALKSPDFMSSQAANVSFCIAHTKVLLYNGQDDIIVNTPSAENWIGKMWGDNEAFYNAELQVWLLPNGTNAGLTQQSGNFTFVIVNKAGHLAPFDQMNSTVDMINRWVYNSNNWTNPNWNSTIL